MDIFIVCMFNILFINVWILFSQFLLQTFNTAVVPTQTCSAPVFMLFMLSFAEFKPSCHFEAHVYNAPDSPVSAVRYALCTL